MFSQALQKHHEAGVDKLSRHLAAIALGRIGGAANRQWLLQAYTRGHKTTERPWLALALGLIGQAVRSVALGIVVTALFQTLVGAAGLFVAGVPYAGILSALMLILCVAQIGPGLVLIPAVIWMYAYDTIGWASVLAAFSLAALTLDNFIRPILIGRGLPLPMTLVMGGVIGGLIAFGALMLVVGATLLGVGGYRHQRWLEWQSRQGTRAPGRRVVVGVVGPGVSLRF